LKTFFTTQKSSKLAILHLQAFLLLRQNESLSLRAAENDKRTFLEQRTGKVTSKKEDVTENA